MTRARSGSGESKKRDIGALSTHALPSHTQASTYGGSQNSLPFTRLFFLEGCGLRRRRTEVSPPCQRPASALPAPCQRRACACPARGREAGPQASVERHHAPPSGNPVLKNAIKNQRPLRRGRTKDNVAGTRRRLPQKFTPLSAAAYRTRSRVLLAPRPHLAQHDHTRKRCQQRHRRRRRTRSRAHDRRPLAPLGALQ